MTDSRLARQTAERLIGSRAQLLKFQCLLGFDGFVDQIFQVVDQRQSPTKYSSVSSMKVLGKRIMDAAGRSANFELVSQTTKIGGNGPIMAFAMSTLGAPVNYIGMLGYPELHPVFTEFAKRCKVRSIAEPAHTSAFEFADGKLMFGQHLSVNDVSWETLKKRLGDTTFRKLWNQSHFIGMVNWTMLPNLSAIWKRLLSDYMPKKKEARKIMFFDLADPAKRLDADLHAALKIIGEFQEHNDVILGLNEAESEHVAKVLRLKPAPANPKGTASLAGAIREKLALHTVVVHPVKYAAGADAEGEFFVNGPYTAKPKISTGAGDHFNAGFVIGRLLGLGLAHSLQLAVAASGFYVRHASSPNREQLVRFLQTL
jgi:sugar/nucleoside kinase (ribokinase family)